MKTKNILLTEKLVAVLICLGHLYIVLAFLTEFENTKILRINKKVVK